MARKRSTAEERSLALLVEGLDELQADVEIYKRTRDIVPAGWLEAHKSTPCRPPKVKTTLRIDREVFDWFHGLGVGYQRRMNEVLRCYMHAVISKHIKQPGDRDWEGEPL